jgi:predicted DsbA family dithiol-disulfide isomerase
MRTVRRTRSSVLTLLFILGDQGYLMSGAQPYDVVRSAIERHGVQVRSPA